MADNKDLTIYQKLFYLFGQNKKPERTTPKYSFGDGDLITTQSKQDYDKQKLDSLCLKVSDQDIDSDTLLNHYLFIQ